MKILKTLLLCTATIAFGYLMYTLSQGGTIALLEPHGPIAAQEKKLMLVASILMGLVVIPVLILTFAIAWRYRAQNANAKYLPNWEHNLTDEIIWWAVPSAIVLFLAALAWSSSHELDPFRPLESARAPIVIQAVALNWKWLFIYPYEGVASVNFVQFPVDTPIEFQITSDAPMNSFWIPQLGGQIYAMQGMRTKLHLMADTSGDFAGSSANFSGRGFAGMRFIARASSRSEFSEWLESVRRSPIALDAKGYEALAKESEREGVVYYRAVQSDLFEAILARYMAPMHAMH